jgi:hypothetical protein
MEKILRLPYFLTISLLIYMPFHIFLSQWLSTFTGGLEVWKIWKDLLLLGAILLALGLVFIKNSFKDRLFWLFTGLSGLYFSLHLLIWQFNSEISDKVALLATAYNSRLLGFAILGWGTAIVAKKYLDIKKVFMIVIIISTVVCLFGIIQYSLPKDFMSHFGYSLDRGVKPNFFIDDKPDLPRIMSTLRDPNSLGAYLIVPITVLVGAWLKRPKLRMLLSGLLLLHGWALFLTFSRSAWLGTLASVCIVLGWVHRKKLKGFARKYSLYVAAAVFALLLGVFLLKDQYFIQNVVFHADESTKLTNPNDLRVDFAQKVSNQIVEQPLGHGPGTAGLVSIQTDKVVLTENYFLQIAYEVGIQGLIFLLALMLFLLRLLWLGRHSTYSKILIASFIGLSISSMLLHTWSNEAVAAQWWLLAGLVVGRLNRRNPSRPAVR